MFKNKARSLGNWISNHIIQFDDVGASKESLKNFDFSVDFLSSDRFQYLYHTFLIVSSVATFIYLRVLASSKFVHYLVVVLLAPFDIELLVIGVVRRAFNTHTLIQVLK